MKSGDDRRGLVRLFLERAGVRVLASSGLKDAAVCFTGALRVG